MLDSWHLFLPTSGALSSLNPVTIEHLRAAGRKKTTPKNNVLVGGSHCRSIEVRDSCKLHRHATVSFLDAVIIHTDKSN